MPEAGSGRSELFTPLEPDLKFTHLTPLEHALFGSSIQVEGLTLNTAAILFRGPEFFLHPLGTLGSEPLDLVTVARGRHLKSLDGIEIFEKYLKDYTSRLELPNIYPDGLIEPFLPFQLINRQTNKAVAADEMRQVLSTIDHGIIEELRDTLSLEIFFPLDSSDRAYLILRLQTPLAHNPYRDFEIKTIS